MSRLLFALAVLLACAGATANAQDRRAQPLFGARTLDAGFTPDPYYLAISVGDGAIDASTISADCMGRIDAAPTAIIRYAATDAASRSLYLSVRADVDTTLAVLAPDGHWYCNDDSAEGLNPLVSFADPAAGRYRIWVGTFAADAGRTDAYLAVSEIGNPAGAGDTPDFSLEPAYGVEAIDGRTMQAPFHIDIDAGGTIDAVAVGEQCRGFVARAPDFRIQWTASGTEPGPLVLSVHSDADTTLLVNGANGEWLCDDDSGGDRDPRITIANAPSGQYDVWVGLYAMGELQPSRLTVSNAPPP